MTILLSPSYFGSKTWELKTKHGVFYLGQDGKICTRLLGMRPEDVAKKVGRDLTKEKNRKKLAGFIMERLGLEEDDLAGMEKWALAAD